uniref:Uncharacterized protein n=1 Tax=Strombidium cf. sulcatum TaxID=2793073 RepID=A0A7T0M4S1_9SPIT|nr:hypothetical protein J6674_mgp18 [Strombidium cf. sulcatum]QPL15971.1 hypothetical protein [Strombidium cf. sulcatum]
MMNFNSLRSFLISTYTKTFGSLKNNMSKFFFLKFFFERNNKNRTPLTKFNYIFHSLKWKNMMISTINFSLTSMFSVLIFLIIVVLFLIGLTTDIYFDLAQNNRICASIYVTFSSIYNDTTSFISLILFTINALVKYFFPTHYNLYKDFVLTSVGIDNSLKYDKTKLSSKNISESSSKYINSFLKSLNLPSNLGNNSVTNQNSPEYLWTLSINSFTTSELVEFADIEFSNLDKISSVQSLFTSTKNFQTSYNIQKSSISNLNLNLNNYNFSEIINVLKVDRWLFKNSLLGNNSVFQMNLINQMYKTHNPFFTSHQWLIKKYFFNNQLKNNMYLISDLFSLNSSKNYNYSLYNFKDLSLSNALSNLNSLYFNSTKPSIEAKVNHKQNLVLSQNNIDLYSGDNLLFLLKLTSNQFSGNSSLVFSPMYQTDFKSPKVTFNFKK